MSSYVHFFVRFGNYFAPLGSFSRNHKIYEAFRYAPYEHIQALTTKRLLETRGDMIDSIEEQECYIAECRKRIDIVQSMSNSVEEKMEYIHEYLNVIRACEEEKECCAFARDYCSFLIGILADIEWEDEIDTNHYLYVGIECGRQPTVDDIV